MSFLVIFEALFRLEKSPDVTAVELSVLIDSFNVIFDACGTTNSVQPRNGLSIPFLKTIQSTDVPKPISKSQHYTAKILI
jgi:hypothetical protein